MDAFSDLKHFGAHDPEMARLLDEYDYATAHGEEGSFNDWLSRKYEPGAVKDISSWESDSPSRQKETNKSRKVCNLRAKDGFWQEAPKNVKKFYQAWTQRADLKIEKLELLTGMSNGVEGIEATLSNGWGGKDSVSVSSGDIVNWFEGAENFDSNSRTIGITFKFDDNEKVALRPGIGEKKAVWILRNLRIEGIGVPRKADIETAGLDKFRFDIKEKTIAKQEGFPKKENIEKYFDPKGFNIKRYNPGLDRYTSGDLSGIDKVEAANNRKKFERFYMIWTEYPDEVDRISFDSDKNGNRIDTVTLYTNDGGVVSVPAWLLRKALTLNRYSDKDFEGIKFVGAGKAESHIAPNTSSEEAKKIISMVNIDGVKLRPDVEVVVGSPF